MPVSLSVIRSAHARGVAAPATTAQTAANVAWMRDVIAGLPVVQRVLVASRRQIVPITRVTRSCAYPQHARDSELSVRRTSVPATAVGRDGEFMAAPGSCQPPHQAPGHLGTSDSSSDAEPSARTRALQPGHRQQAVAFTTRRTSGRVSTLESSKAGSRSSALTRLSTARTRCGEPRRR